MNLFSEFERTDFESWQKEAERLLKGKPLDSLSYLSDEGIKIHPLYTQRDLPQEFKNEFPGFKYYLRSNKVCGYRTLPWKVVQRIDVASPEKANNIITSEIQNGINGFIIKTYDFTSDNLNGVVISGMNDFETLFDNVDIANTCLHFKTTFPIEFLALFIAFLEKKQISGQKIFGSIQYDFYGSNLSKGRLLEKNSLKNLFLECYQLCKSYLPNFKSFVIDGTVFHECGATATQELSFTISKALELLKGLSQLGVVDIKELPQKILFKISLGSNIFFNIGKIRALRLLWAFIIEQFNIANDSFDVPIYAITSERNKSKLDIYVNMLRNTAETFSAIIGTADYIEVKPYDFLVSEPSEFSMRNSRNTHLVLMEEHNLRDVIDPAGGSWFIEAITWEIAHKSFEMLKNIESQGGFYENLLNGNIQDEISKAKTNRIKKLSNRDIVLVGVNRFPNPQDKSESSGQESNNYYQDFKGINFQCEKEFEKLNLDDLIQIVKSRHSILSLSPVSYNEKNFLKIERLLKFREASEFENLRLMAFRYRTKYGKSPKVLAITFGASDIHRELVDFVNEFFQIGGFEVSFSGDIFSVEEAFAKFAALLPQVVVFCSSLDKYAEFVPQLAHLILKYKPLTVILIVGQIRDELFSKWKEFGINDCIHPKSDTLSILHRVYQLISSVAPT